MEGIVLEPLAHAVIRKGHCDEHGKGDEFQEVTGQQRPETEDTGAEDFADPDLLCPLFSHKGSQAEEAETGDKDGKAREDSGEVADAGLGIELPLEHLVVE